METWIEYSGVKGAVTPENGPGEVVDKSAGGHVLKVGDDHYGVCFGGMLKLIAKDYANWDRTDKRFPLSRTFDPWAGHSFAGGIGDGAGNGQESSSEAMQGSAS